MQHLNKSRICRLRFPALLAVCLFFTLSSRWFLKVFSFLLVAIVIALDTQLEGTLSKAIQWKLKENSTNFREGRKRVVKARVNFGLLAIAVKLATIDMEYSMYIKKKFHGSSQLGSNPEILSTRRMFWHWNAANS